jgi:hypothetical protein
VTRVGITAGASTPEFLIHEAVEALRRIGAVEAREVHVVEEDVRFGLPHELVEIAKEGSNPIPVRLSAARSG